MLVAALGLVATLLGTVIGAVLAGRKADRREELRWQRDWVRQHELWAREDTQRTFDQKRDAYVGFHQQLQVTSLMIFDMLHRQGPPLDDRWQLPLYESLLRVRIFASREVTDAASRVYAATLDWGSTQPHEVAEIVGARYSPGEEEHDTAVETYLETIRRDLGVEMPSLAVAQR